MAITTSFQVGVARQIIPIDPQWITDGSIYVWGFAGDYRQVAVKQADVDARVTAGDQLTVTALVLTDEAGTTVALAAIDVGNLASDTTDRVRAAVNKKTGIPAANVCLNVSHTHAAPTMVECSGFPGNIGKVFTPFRDSVESVTVAAIVAAYNARQAAEIYVGRGTTDLGYNRRWGGPSEDQILDVFHARTVGGTSAIATVFRAAVHPVWLTAPTVSADYVGVARRTVESLTGAPSLYVQGWAGNCDPKTLVGDPSKDQNHQTTTHHIWSVTDSMELMNTHGSSLGNQVGKVLSYMHGHVSTSGMTRLAGAVTTRSTTLAHPLQAGGSVNQPVQAIIVGAGASAWHFVGCGHEVTTDQAPRAQTQLPYEHVTLAGYCNYQQGYVPSDRHISEGTYEGNSSQTSYGQNGPYSLGVSDRLLDGIVTVTDPGWKSMGNATSVVAMAAMGSYLYCVTGNDILWRRPAAGGDTPWERLGSAQQVVGLAALDGTIYCATRADDLWSRPAEGTDLGWQKIGHAMSVVAMTATAGQLYCATSANGLWTRAASQDWLPWTTMGTATAVRGLATVRGHLISINAGAGGTAALYWRSLAVADETWKRFSAVDPVVGLCSIGDQLYCATPANVLWTRSL